MCPVRFFGETTNSSECLLLGLSLEFFPVMMAHWVVGHNMTEGNPAALPQPVILIAINSLTCNISLP